MVRLLSPRLPAGVILRVISELRDPRWTRKVFGHGPFAPAPYAMDNLASTGRIISIKVEELSPVSSAAVQLIPVPSSYLPNLRPSAIVIRPFLLHSKSSCSLNRSSPSSSAPSTSTPWPFRSPVNLLLSQTVSFPDRSPPYFITT